MTVAIYIRVSTQRQAAEGYSLDAQKKTLEDFCNQHKYNVYKVYTDEGASGKDIQHREAFSQMLADAAEKNFNAVIVWKLTRFTRSIKDLINVCDILERYDVALISCSEAFDTGTPSGRMVRNLLGVIAQWEREVISENIRLANREKIEQGYSLSTYVLGYDCIDRNLIINDLESKIVQEIFALYIKVQNLSEVARRLNQAGYKSKNSHDFTAQSILTILSNPIYCGYNRSKGLLYKGNQAAIINVDTYNFVQRIIASSNNGRKRKHKLISL